MWARQHGRSPPAEMPAPAPPTPSDRALGALRALGHEQRLSLGGMMAVLLGRHAAWWDLEPPAETRSGTQDRFCATLLKVVMCGLLQLPADQFTALEPLSRPPPGGAPISPEPFVASLPESREKREEMLHGLLVLMAVGVAATGRAGAHNSKTKPHARDSHAPNGKSDQPSGGALEAGYDARSRQLLVECASALGVPWAVMARREADLAAALACELREQRQAARREREAQEAAARTADTHSRTGLGMLGKRWKRGAAVVGVGIASGAAVALTAGLAAPAVLGGLAAVGGGISAFGAAGAVVGTAVGSLTAILSGGAGVAVSDYKMLGSHAHTPHILTCRLSFVVSAVVGTAVGSWTAILSGGVGVAVSELPPSPFHRFCSYFAPAHNRSKERLHWNELLCGRGRGHSGGKFDDHSVGRSGGGGKQKQDSGPKRTIVL
jgi:hypothetical protein